MSDSEDKKGPGVKYPPPLIVSTLILLAYALEFLASLPIIAGAAPWPSGSIVLAIALLMAAIAALQFRRAKTHLEPWKPTSSIIKRGVYRYSRNPIYLAFCIATLGIGMILNSWWVVGAVLPQVYLLQHFVIAREETYLQTKFGDEYLAYQKKVRRWI